jgi:predicted Zn-dependent protease with MMP-like domain
MLEISDEQFAAIIAEVMDELPSEHMDAVKNVAIVYEDEPTPEQREKLLLRNDQSLFGLYEGIPLAKRQGMTGFVPDKITIFKHPMLEYTGTYEELRAQVKHTLWHEIAHYFGLDHPAIHDIERRWKN